MHNKMGEPPVKRLKPDHSNVSLEEIAHFYEQSFQDSNFFKLQVDQLLMEISVKDKTYSFLNKWLAEFTSLIKGFSSSKQFQLQEKSWLQEQKLVMPFKLYEDLPELPGGTFKFSPPVKVCYVGSIPLKIATGQQKTADIMLTLPKEFMEHQDMTNGRWLIRRALYLAWLGKLLSEQETKLIASLHWSYHCNCPLRPMLQIIPGGKIVSKWRINLFPVPSENYYKLNKISPERHNLNSSWFFRREENKDGKKGPATPYHNWACGVDLVMADHFSYMKEHLKYENIIQGIKLLKIWLTQRNLNQGEGSLSNHTLTLYVLHLLRIRKISPQMSPYIIFRTVLIALSTEKWFESGPSLAPKNDEVSYPSNSSFHSRYPVVFIGPTGYLNVASSTLKQIVLEMQHEAMKSISLLESSVTSSEKFDALFINKVDFHLNFDQLFHIELSKKQMLRVVEKIENLEDSLLDHLGDVRHLAWENVYLTLNKAFGDRLILLGILRNPVPSWQFGEPPPRLSTDMTLGFLLNPTTAYGLLTKGPSADLPETKEFREFWGEISSLRRFQDTSFHEAILWGDSGTPVGDRRLIPGKIATYILKHQFNLKEKNLSYIADQFEKTLRGDHFKMEAKYGTGEEVGIAAILAYDSLSKKLRSLDLPLKISTVQSSSPLIKQSLVFPPLPKAVIPPMKGSVRKAKHTTLPPKNNLPHFRFAIKVLIFLELSGKWPDDLQAIQAIKVEFLSKIAELLKPDGVTCIIFPKYLQIIWQGYIFQIEVCYRREIYLRQLKYDKATEQQSVHLESPWELEKHIEIFPKIATYLNSLQSEFPSYNGSVRLILRWISSQMLLPHLPHIVVELLVAFLFLRPAPFGAPSTPHVAFLRFLHLISTVDFKRIPFIVNLGALLSADEEMKIAEKFTQDRSELPLLFICTPCELKRGHSVSNPNSEESQPNKDVLSTLSSSFEWTQSLLPPILNRLKLLASAALKYYRSNIFGSFDHLVLFRPSLDDYDVCIYLESKLLSRRSEGLTWEKHITIDPYTHSPGERMPTVMFDPVQYYLRELRAAYDTHAIFFHDEFGGEVIGVVWRPESSEPQTVKVNVLCGHKFIGTENTKQRANKEAFIEDFEIIGKGLVKNVKSKR